MSERDHAGPQQELLKEITQKNKELQELREQLRLKETMYEDMVMQLKEVVFQTNEKGEWTFLNPAWTEITGFSIEETLGTHFLDYIPQEERPEAEKEFARIIRAGETTYRKVKQYVTKAGGLTWVEVIARFQYGPDGTLSGTAGTIADVNERILAEQKLRDQKNFYESILNHVPAEIAVWDEQFRYRFLNPVASPRQEVREWLIGKTDFDFCIKYGKGIDVAQKRRASQIEAVRNKQLMEWEERFEKNDGATIYHLRRIKPVFNEGGQFKYMIGYGMNITERKEAEVQMKRAKEAAEASVKAKEIFLSNFSHEVRTPLNGITGMTELLFQTCLDDKQKHYLNMIQDSAENLLVIINDILDLSRIESGKLDLESVPVDMVDILNKVISNFIYRARDKGINLQMKPLPRKGIYVNTDPVRMFQVFSNLVSNAIKFTEKGYVEVSVTIEEENEKTLTCSYAVKDTGIGIPEEKLPYIFDRFSQADPSITRKYGGTGLGLSITKNLIELFGGEIAIESQRNVGTTFMFSVTHEKADPQQGWKQPGRTKEDFSVLKGARILLAEDNQVNQLVASSMLKLWHIEVDTAADGQETLQMLKENDYDLVLMDIQMPVMSGVEATMHIRQIKDEKKAQIPIIALTANAMKGEYEKYLEAGMDDYISKPYRSEELLGKIKRLLEQSASKNQAPDINLLNIETKMKNNTRTYDLRALEEQMMGDKDIVKSVVEMFIMSVPAELELMQASFEGNDMVSIGKIAHKLKSNVNMLNITPLKEDVRTLEKAPEMEKEEVQPLLDNFISTMHTTIKQLQEDIDTGMLD